jgi:hypothetical protein
MGIALFLWFRGSSSGAARLGGLLSALLAWLIDNEATAGDLYREYVSLCLVPQG